MGTGTRPLAMVTGASNGIGFELGKLAAMHGFDMVVAADRPEVEDAAAAFADLGAVVEPIDVDLGSMDGVDLLLDRLGGRQVDALLANAGSGLDGAFLDQDFEEIRQVIDTNITGTVNLIHNIAHQMRDRGQGKILITGAMAGMMPGMFQAVNDASRAFIDAFACALRAELKDTGVTVTCLIPGSTETDFFEHAKIGFEAMMRGEADVVLAKMHRRPAGPGSGTRR